MHLTIERLRTMVLAAGILLIAALAVFLVIGKYKSPFKSRDLPKKLGIDIQQEANGFTHAEFRAGHAMFKITASKVEQLKNDHYRLHFAKIEMYSPDGKNVDRIEGGEFEYDQKTGIATAAGPVEITLTRPSKSSGAPAAPALTGATQSGAASGPGPNEIQVETSGLSFNENTGVATTTQHVAFTLAQGSGSSIGATYNSQNGALVLDHTVELDTHRGADPVKLTAQHAQFDRDDQVCWLNQATADYRDGRATSTAAKIQFRDDGSMQQLDASNGFVLTTANGARLAAPIGTMLFNLKNQPSQAHLEGGVVLDSENDKGTMHGTAPTAQLEFTAAGILRHAHLERGVNATSDKQMDSSSGPVALHRTWASPIADLEFRDAGHGQAELASIHGIEGVRITSTSKRGNGPAAPSRLSADDVTGTFGPNSALTAMTGLGHASVEETTATGTVQTTSGDRLEAHFVPANTRNARPKDEVRGSDTAASQIESATVLGNVVLFQQPASKSGAAVQPAMRATSDRAVYEGAGEWLHLTGNPRVENGGLQLTADKIDVSQGSGDAFAHGDVKATWIGGARSADPLEAASRSPGPALGGQGPSHVVSEEAQLHQPTGEATFSGNARLWQQGNSVAAPIIILDRTKQTLVARTTDPAEPVRVVLVRADTGVPGNKRQSDTPSVIRVRGGDLKYSDAERTAVMQSGVMGTVVAETPEATTHSRDVKLVLLPPGNHAGPNGAAAQVDRMTARGHVTIDSQGRRGTGEQLDYTSESDNYVLTGTAGVPPRMTDPVRGMVTGEALIFNSRDDSVNVEGDGRKTTTVSTVPKRS